MIKIFKLTKRHMDDNDKLPKQLKEIKVFSTCVGHGIGTIDFSQKVLEISDEEYDRIVANSGEYARFKLGNLSKYFEVEIFIEHAQKLVPDMCECEFKELLKALNEGYLVVKKDF